MSGTPSLRDLPKLHGFGIKYVYYGGRGRYWCRGQCYKLSQRQKDVFWNEQSVIRIAKRLREYSEVRGCTACHWFPVAFTTDACDPKYSIILTEEVPNAADEETED